MNIYINSENTERLEQYAAKNGSKSGLVNRLLNEFFGRPEPVITPTRKEEPLPSGGKKVTLGMGDSVDQSQLKQRSKNLGPKNT